MFVTKLSSVCRFVRPIVPSDGDFLIKFDLIGVYEPGPGLKSILIVGVLAKLSLGPVKVELGS